MTDKKSIKINGCEYLIENERNVLEIARKAGIDIPTFCYHSELSVYGACRMCLVEIEGRGIVTSCSTPPENGMVIWTNTREVRNIRKINLELLLANHERECTTCLKNGTCSLQRLSRTMGIDNIRYRSTVRNEKHDISSSALIRDPNKCVLCGDCVRACEEIQGIGAIDFAWRGANAKVVPVFNRRLGEIECVDCGQCARVCPTGAIVPKPEIDAVWSMIDDPTVTVVAQVAPAIRVALGEYFSLPIGTITTGKLIATLRKIGFDSVYDTAFTADVTVIEEGSELLNRLSEGKHLPLITSCCPAWVKYAEQYFPELLENLSTCRSPQQMFGSLAHRIMPDKLGKSDDKFKVVSIMPCTAKKAEAGRHEFTSKNGRDVDAVITTQELGKMIESAGIRFTDLKDEDFDMPFGIASGAGIIFGMSGGVTEAVVRFAAEKITGDTRTCKVIQNKISKGITELTVNIGETSFKSAVVSGLKNARTVCKEIMNGTSPYQVIEVMACPGGCINGAGQPVITDFNSVAKRAEGLRYIDNTSKISTTLCNSSVAKIYCEYLGHSGSTEAYNLLHTHYFSKKRVKDDAFHLLGSAKPKLSVSICVGTNCCLGGAHDLMRDLVAYVNTHDLHEIVEVKAAFCFEKCSGKAPMVMINNDIVAGCTFAHIQKRINDVL
jgi:NADH-quinone oxidoreductase subunit G